MNTDRLARNVSSASVPLATTAVAIPAPGALGLLALAGGAAGIRRKRQA
ncbi:MAG: PEP-CTERM sorting domain-containing protein [Planctomycetia bacterium]|jgi:hypothetical protein|nr:PEP-CTERM sorting domain-containing protein [Planctomycetia bacterium]